MRLPIARQGIVLALVPLLFQLALVSILVSELHNVEKILNNQGLLREIAKQHNMLLYDYGEYLISNTLYLQYGDEDLEKKRSQNFLKIKQEIARLKELTRTDPTLSKRFSRFEQKFNKNEKMFVRKEKPLGNRFFLSENKDSSFGMNQPTQFFSDSSRQIELRYQHYRALIKDGFNRVIGTGISISIFLSLLLTFLFSRHITSRLLILKENASKMALRLPLHSPVGGSDEISLLDSVFHRMANDTWAADSQKKQLLTMISDSLEEPLQRAITHLTLAKESESENSPIQKKLNPLRGNLLRLCSLIQDLLDTESIDSGGMELSLSPCNISVLIEAALSAIQGYLNSKELKIVTTESDTIILADTLKLEQVLINFLSNAIKFSPRGATIEITAEQPSADSIKIAVIDQGPGIPEDKRKRLFNRFDQINPEADTKIGGSGLGLSICKTIIEAHGGEIGATDLSGQGSSFWFCLPNEVKPHA